MRPSKMLWRADGHAAAQACRVAKLFAKHMKLPEQQKHLENHVLGIGCGTPNRLLKLADVDALKLDRLRLLVLDMQLDAKQRWHTYIN